jgi:Flp pilus assembly protein TadD
VALELQQGRTGPALALALEVTQLAPEFGLGWYNLGLIHRQRGDLAGAIAAYREAIALEPSHVEAHQNLAVASLLAGQIQAARDGFRCAITLLREQNRHQEAEDLAGRAGALLRLDPI